MTLIIPVFQAVGECVFESRLSFRIGLGIGFPFLKKKAVMRIVGARYCQGWGGGVGEVFATFRNAGPTRIRSTGVTFH